MNGKQEDHFEAGSEGEEDSTYFEHVVSAEHHGQRIDKILSGVCEGLSRARAQKLIENGDVLLNGAACVSSARKLQEEDHIGFVMPAPEEYFPVAENIPLDVIYEDRHLIVLNKPAGLVVHPGAGNPKGTLVNALLHHCRGNLSGVGGVLRPGIVHRLDKETSGLIVAAKDDQAHQGLSAQLQDRSLSRIYHALVLKVPMPPKGVISQPIGRHPVHRQKMTTRRMGGREARTFYKVEKSYGAACALVECQLETGRTHQIRVHMEFLKHPVIGDPLYGPEPNALSSALKKAGASEEDTAALLAFPRQALHARFMSFIHPVSGENMSFEAPMAEDIVKLLFILNKFSNR